MMRMMLALVLGLAVLVPAGWAEEKKDETYIKVEAKGMLQTGIVAIGGETTGTLLKTKAATVELDFSKVKDKPDKFDKKTVIVTGALTFKKGVTQKGTRTIIVVATIKEAK